MKLVKHSFYNFMGLSLPLLVAAFVVPALIFKLGEARFGVLTLIWALVSYAGLFDLGFGRALTQQLSIMLEKNEQSKISSLVCTTLIVLGATGILAGLLIYSFAPLGATLIKSVPNKQEIINCIHLIGIFMPFIILISGLRGILESYHAFGVINSIRLPMGAINIIGPLMVVLLWNPRLDHITFVLGMGRVVACVLYAYFAFRALPKIDFQYPWSHRVLKKLWKTGSWLTVTNIISPLMGYIDRFFVASLASATALAYYATPNELITKLWLIPGAITSVLFPIFAAKARGNESLLWLQFCKSIKIIFSSIFPLTLLTSIFAPEIMSLWINSNFSEQSSILLRIFSFGILINCISHVPYTLMQGAGESRRTALIHLWQLPIFIVVIWLMTINYGLIGTALAWTFRMVADALLMFTFCSPLLDKKGSYIFNKQTLLIFCLVLFAFFGCIYESLTLRTIWLGLSILIAFRLFYRKWYSITFSTLSLSKFFYR